MKIKTIGLVVFGAASIAGFSGNPAHAVDFSLSGTFSTVRGCDEFISITPTACNPFTLVNQLVGGSFDGTYSTSGNLPVGSLTPLSNVSINLRNAAGDIVTTYTSGFVGNNVLSFSNNAFSFLELRFSAGFNGNATSIFPSFLRQNAAGFGSTTIGAIGTSVPISTDPPTPIPTPALLPGLIGMGIAAICKRKAEQKETVEV